MLVWVGLCVVCVCVAWCVCDVIFFFASKWVPPHNTGVCVCFFVLLLCIFCVVCVCCIVMCVL